MPSVDCFFSFWPLRTPSPRNEGARPRARAAALLGATALGLALLAGSPAGAQTAPRRAATRPDSIPHRAKPFSVMLRSAAVPGWGQVYNHKIVKAAAVVGVEGFLVFGALQELKRQNQALDREAAILGAGGDVTDPAYTQAVLDESTHRNRKISYIWFGIAAHLLSMADAYVDAHLASFDADFGPPESAVDVGEAPRLTLAYRARF